jgi:reverse gyrase
MAEKKSCVNCGMEITEEMPEENDKCSFCLDFGKGDPEIEEKIRKFAMDHSFRGFVLMESLCD